MSYTMSYRHITVSPVSGAVSAEVGGACSIRCAQHYALDGYHDHHRLMHRITIRGARPE